MNTLFVKTDTTKLYLDANQDKALGNLLWGDRVIHDPANPEANGRLKVQARGKTGFVKKADLDTTSSLLEVYFIDVGQGDGLLIRTPDDRHILIDGGYRRKYQPAEKNAADFVDWKFFKDYGRTKMVLDAVIASHCDADHYGGLWDLLNPNEQAELDIQSDKIKVKNFFHAGVGWLKKGTARSLGPIKNGFLTLLMGDKNNLKTMLKANPTGYQLQGDWADFIQTVVDKADACQRVSHKTGYLPGYSPSAGKAAIKVLAPIEEKLDGKPALRSLGTTDKNTNGHSVTLRVDYGKVRILLTGDLNAAAQKFILQHYENQEKEFSCDVAKACHHGSDDCSYEFLSHVGACATVISSGDSEGHNHPRPAIVAASALTGHKTIKADSVVTPLIYSTEIARSYRLGSPYELVKMDDNSLIKKTEKINVRYEEKNSGDLQASKKEKDLWGRKIVSGIVYGLVNVRTDGEKILCATMSEIDGDWDVRTFNTRF